MRSLAVVLILAATCAAAFAEDAAPAPGRYAIRPADDGFVRLDTQTGAVTHCGQQDGVWHCDILAEDTAATDQRLAALAAEVLALRHEVDALAARLGAAENPPAKDGASGGAAKDVAGTGGGRCASPCRLQPDTPPSAVRHGPRPQGRRGRLRGDGDKEEQAPLPKPASPVSTSPRGGG